MPIFQEIRRGGMLRCVPRNPSETGRAIRIQPLLPHLRRARHQVPERIIVPPFGYAKRPDFRERPPLRAVKRFQITTFVFFVPFVAALRRPPSGGAMSSLRAPRALRVENPGDPRPRTTPLWLPPGGSTSLLASVLSRSISHAPLILVRNASLGIPPSRWRRDSFTEFVASRWRARP